MAATLQQHCASNANTATRATNTANNNPNPQLKRLVYSKYRELLGSYNEQANAYIDTLPSYMVQKDTGFSSDLIINSTGQNGNHHHQDELYGAGQRMPAQQTYEAPACVQNAMMTKDKKPFTYTPGGIDLSQIKSERMAKRLARNAQAEGATGVQQLNRPTQPQSPGGSSPSAAASMGAAAMGMPFQVLPPPPPPSPGKNFNGGSAPAPPPPPPSSSNFSNVGTLAPPTNGNGMGGRSSAPNSPSMARKSPTPQRFEPPPMGFRPEIKIPPNPMAALRKVPTPVEKNTFWKDEYVKERSKSPMVDLPNNASSNNDSVNSISSSPQTTNANNNGTATLNNDNIDGFKKTMPTTTTNNSVQQNQANNNYTNHEQPLKQQQQLYTPPTVTQQTQQSPIKTIQQSPQYGDPQPQTQNSQQSLQQHQQPTKPEFRSVAAPTSPAVNVYTRQSDSPRTAENATPPRATESPFKFSPQQQQRAPPAVSPLAQQSIPSTASSASTNSPTNQAQTVPWRTQRGPSQHPQQQAQPSAVAQSHPQPIYNNVQHQQQRSPDFSTQQSPYQGPKPTNIGSLYIAPLAPPTEPQAQHIVRQQMQQQHRDSPTRQVAPQQQQHQPNQQLRWMSTQPMNKEQPAWVRPEENGNVVPSSLNRIKSPPPTTHAPQHTYQPPNQGNGIIPQTFAQNFGTHPINSTGLRLQISTPVNPTNSQNGPKERIIPIQLEQTPTYTPTQPSFSNGAGGGNPPAPGYVMRTPNQFVDQGYHNFGQQQQQLQQQQQSQRVMSPTMQQLNAPRMVQQTQNNVATGNKTHIIPIAIENNEGTRGPISKTPIVIQNDQRTPPVQSKSFRILQKITDTIDDGTSDDNVKQQPQHLLQEPIEPQLQRPTFARQMSAQQARPSPTVEQMRRIQIGHEPGNYSAPTTPSAFKYNQQRSFYDNSQQYIPPSEQQVPEPKKYTGSAIPSRSFKILQAMTQPENAEKIQKNDNIMNHVEKQENCAKKNEMNEIGSKPESNTYTSCASSSSNTETVSSPSSTTINSELAFSSSPSPTPPLTQPTPYLPYPCPYGYPWYLPPPPHMPSGPNSEHCPPPPNWLYPLPGNAATEQPIHYPPYPYYYPYYPSPTHSQMPPHFTAQTPCYHSGQCNEYDTKNMYPTYMAPPHPYLAYPFPIAPSYSQGSNSSRASSVLPDIIITPSTDDIPSKVIMKHHIKVEKDLPRRAGSIDIEDVTSLKSDTPVEGSIVDVLTQQLENMSQSIKNNLNTNCRAQKSYEKNIEHKSPEANTSPVQVTMVMSESERDSDQTNSDSELTPKQVERKVPVPLKSIKSVNNVQVYKGQKLQQLEEESSSDSESEGEEDDETTADGESDIFDEEDDERNQNLHQFERQEDSESEEFIIDDNLSVIYEEESEMEKSNNLANNHKQYEKDEEHEDSNSVTVRLPLKFSFTTSKDVGNITTLEVGKSQVGETRISNSLKEKYNSFDVAPIKSSDSEEDECENCDVSVTISLNSSSKSISLDDKVESKSKSQLYARKDKHLPELASEETELIQKSVTTSLSLNTRNKFVNETNKCNIINNNNKERHQEEGEKIEEVTEEIDFFATLMATKMQAQKIKEQSANYWGKSQQKNVEESEIQEIAKDKSQKTKHSKKKGLKKSKPGTTTEVKVAETKGFDKTSANNMQQIKEASFKLQENYAKPKFSFWDRCSIATKESETQEINGWEQKGQSPVLQSTEDQTGSEILTHSDKEDRNDFFIHSAEKNRNAAQTESSAIKQEPEEIVDIWADRQEDLPPIKPIKRKLKTLENVKEPFWSNVYETEKLPEIVREKALQQSETITKIDLKINVLNSSTKELQQPQMASLDYVTEERAEVLEETEEIDFWAEIEKARMSKTPEPRQGSEELCELPEMTTNGFKQMHSYGEQECSMFNCDDMPAIPCVFDPYKYPEEPREVDTDEEFDFWAEIEAKRQAQDDDVTFEKSASFWASRERQNSVEETPYKPVLPKAFHAKLPDDPPIEDISVWQTLEAHKGEEPLIIDPQQLEEDFLVQEYEDMITNQELSKDELNDEFVSASEPPNASVWCPQSLVNQEQAETMKTYIEEDKPETNKPKIEEYELEVKRSNYRKAMAFFTTSIDETKEQNVDRYESSKTKSSRSSCIEEENEQWDWDAVNEALEQEKSKENNETAVKEELVKEQTPQVDLSVEITPKEKNLSEVNVAPTTKLLPNGLPDLEVNKFNEDRKISVKDRISAFETGTAEKAARKPIQMQSLSVDSNTRQSSLSRNSSIQRSESEMDEDDSGVTDMNKQLSETDTEPENFPELRKMSSYQRASTHSRLFKLLQEDPDVAESNQNSNEYQFKPSRKRIVHNVSITRKQNPASLAEAETMNQRRERLSLPLRKNTSIDNDNPSTPNSPASPIMGHSANKSSMVSEKLVSELVQSLLLKSDSTHFRKLPMEKLQAAAKRVLEEELDSLENTSIDSTTAFTPSEMKKDKSYADYYNTWSDALGADDIVPSKSFRALQDSRRCPWTARCPRVLSSKTINRDLARVTESPEISMHNNKNTEFLRQSREASTGRWNKT